MKMLAHSALVRVILVLALALVLSSPALASHERPHLDAREAAVAGGLFTPTRLDGEIEWRVRWVLTPEAAEELAAGETRVVRFAVPLTDAESIESTWGVVPLTEAGHVVGVRVDRAATDGRVVSAVVHQRLPPDGALGLRIGAPVAAGTALQIIDADLGSGTRLDVYPLHTLERRVGYVAPAGVSHAAREEARRLTGFAAGVRGAAIYVRGEDVKSARGLSATVLTPRARGRSGVVGLAVAFGGIVIALVVAAKKLRHEASVERADAVLAAEVDALEPSSRRPG